MDNINDEINAAVVRHRLTGDYITIAIDNGGYVSFSMFSNNCAYVCTPYFNRNSEQSIWVKEKLEGLGYIVSTNWAGY